MKLPLPGEVLTNDLLKTAFDVGNMGGMRKSNKNNLLVLISDHTKSLYEDRWEGNVVHYTGMGTIGDQTITSQNKTVFNSLDSNITMYFFEVFEKNKYIYAGKVKLASSPYVENQIDNEGNERKVYMFPLRLIDDAIRPTPELQELVRLEATKERLLLSKSLAELLKRAKTASKKPLQRQIRNKQIVRNPAIAAYVKKAAEGNCDLCTEPAPFVTKVGPYLESHHVIPLAEDGEDCISNAVALCPNCHRKMHALKHVSDIRILKNRIITRDS